MDQNNKKKVLVIEDDVALASAYKAKLSHRYDTRNASSGDEGVGLVHEWKPDLILLDLFLPGKTGHEVLNDIKKHEHTKHIPVIVLTNLEDQCNIVLGRGAIDCAVKTDISMAEIVERIDKHLQ